jgi:DNA-binding IclR family transcriptional regulator
MNSQNGTKTLGRALDILFVLTDAETTLSVSEIAERVNVPESTAYRLIKTLEQNGIIERKSKGEIGLGMRILDLAKSLYQQIDRELFAIALPIMEELTKQINETSMLVVRTGLSGICVQHVESSRLIRFMMENGRTLPLHLGASGKAILAFEDKKVINRVYDTLTENEIKNLQYELEKTREKGYIITVGEVDQDVFGVATPIYDIYDRVVASLSIVGPKNRFDDNQQNTSIQALFSASNEIANKLKKPVFL